jgi:hypothetical protein
MVGGELGSKRGDLGGRKEIVKAIANLEATGISLVNQFIALNQWNY